MSGNGLWDRLGVSDMKKLICKNENLLEFWGTRGLK